MANDKQSDRVKCTVCGDECSPYCAYSGQTPPTNDTDAPKAHPDGELTCELFDMCVDPEECDEFEEPCESYASADERIYCCGVCKDRCSCLTRI